MEHKRSVTVKAQKKGYTLVEAIASLALTALFLAAAAIVLAQSLRLHHRLKTATDALLVSEIILDKVTGEIAGAKNGGYGGSTVIITSTGSTGCPAVTLTTRDDRRVEITLDRAGEDARLLLLFAPTKADPEESRWTFDEKLYQGYGIDALGFEHLAREDGSLTNVIRVSLKLRDKKTGRTYRRDRSVSCSHFVTEEDMTRIRTE